MKESIILNFFLLFGICYLLYNIFYNNKNFNEIINNKNNNKKIYKDLDKELENIFKNENINIDKELEPIFDKNNKIQDTYSTSLNNSDHNTTLPKVYLNIKAGKKELGQIIIKLFVNNVPKTCENFRALCSGEQGYTRNGKKLSYKGTPFHRIIPNFMIQGGDIDKKNGTGRMSIYGDTFPDESFIIQHNSPGIVSMANSGKDSNGSQFFIITEPQPHLDNKHVAFGKVIKGMEIIKEVEQLGQDNGEPIVNVIISDCGII